MESRNKGWIKLYRQIQDCEIWFCDQEEPFDRRSAWIDLLLLANHRDKNTIFDGKAIVIQRGKYLCSVRKLAERWGWGKDKTLNYLRLLENLGMIKKESDSRKTLLTIVNYDIYQGEDTDSQTVNRQSTDSQQTVSRQSPATNKNIKNYKNEKNNNIVPPTLDMVRDYCNERCNGISAESFIDFYESKGWLVGKTKMKDWQAAIRTWEQKKGFKYVPPKKQYEVKEEPEHEMTDDEWIEMMKNKDKRGDVNG